MAHLEAVEESVREIDAVIEVARRMVQRSPASMATTLLLESLLRRQAEITEELDRTR
jgi:hypothetical protein